MIKTSKAFTSLIACFGLTLFVVGFAAPQTTDENRITPSGIAAEIPEEAKLRKNPIAPDRESIEWGGMYFSSQCTMCHGADGRGGGDLVERLQLKIPDFTDPAMQAQWTDGELFYVLTKGHGRMPAQKDRFNEKTKWSLVNYVRSFLSNG